MPRDDVDGFLAMVDEDVEFTSMVAEAEGTTFRGHEGVREWWETVRGAFEDPMWEVVEIRESGEGVVLKIRLDGTLSGVPMTQSVWQASTLRDGKVSWWGFFRTEGEALVAVGTRGSADRR
jgi:ketosteroid isomerase-like protein